MFGTERVAAENRDYQQRLAASLVGTMGIERAVEACLSNGWDGVLERVPCAARTSDGWRPGSGSTIMPNPLPLPARAVEE